MIDTRLLHDATLPPFSILHSAITYIGNPNATYYHTLHRTSAHRSATEIAAHGSSLA